MADSPSSQEKRAGIPAGQVGVTSISDRWITSQVFVDKKKNQRIYYALQDSNWYQEPHGGSALVSIHGGRYYDSQRSRRDDDWKFWQIGAYHSMVGAERTSGRDIISESDDLRELLRELATLEKNMKEDGYTPVPGLAGNYRDVAAKHGWYFDDRGNLLNSDKTAITTNAALSRKNLSALYTDIAQKKSAPATFQTWEDFHREVTDKVDISMFTDPATIDDWFVKCSKEELENIAALDQKIADDSLPVRERELAVNYVYCHGAHYKEQPALDYQYYTMRLTAMMRAGQKVYAALLAAPTTEGHLHMLEYLQQDILRMNAERFGFTSEMAVQSANLITQGPDPRMGQPYPLERILAQPKAAVPKPYSP